MWGTKHFILTFWLSRCLFACLDGMMGLLWSERVLGFLRGLWILRVLRYLWSLWVAWILWPAGQLQWGLGGWRLRIGGALFLPKPSCVLQITMFQLSERNLHIRARVGISMTSWTDLLEMVCIVGNTQQQTINHRNIISVSCFWSPKANTKHCLSVVAILLHRNDD